MADREPSKPKCLGLARELELCEQVVSGLRAKTPISHKLPNMISGRIISDEVATAIVDFGVAWQAQQTGLGEAINAKDRDTLVRNAFGKCFPDAEVDLPVQTAARALRDRVTVLLREDVESFAQPRTFHFGCWLVRDQRLSVDLGPVQIIPRAEWLDGLERAGTIDALISRRVRHAWQGRRLRKRKAANSQAREHFVLDTVRECPDVCSVTVENMASGIGEEKAILAARLALTIISLIWKRPSKAVEGFGLLLDGEHRNARFMATRSGTHNIGSYSRAQRLPGSTWTEEDIGKLWSEAEWLRRPATKVLAAFLTGRLLGERDAIDRALFLATWWMHEAIHAETALLATAKFGAVLDTLAGGRGKGHHIRNMLSERLGVPREGSVTRRGQTMKQIVGTVFGEARSMTLHGLNDRFGHDWTDARGLAEVLARDALAATMGWAAETQGDRLPDYSKAQMR